MLPRPAWRSTWLPLAAVALAAAAVLLFVQRSVDGMYGYDGPFHIRYSQILRDELSAGHGFPRTFPWWQETFLRDRWADKDLLYHLLLTPFTSGDPATGGKTASIVFGALLYAALFVSLRWLNVRGAWLWTLACLVSSTWLLYRAGLVRSHVLAIAIMLAGIAAILRGSRAGIFIGALAYALTHIGWHLLPGLALLHDASCSLIARRLRVRSAPWALGGTLLAIVIHPNFPANLRLWWVQNIDVLGMAWLGGHPDLSLGREFLPAGPLFLLSYNIGPLVLSLAGFALLAARHRAGSRADASALTLAMATAVMMALTLASRRFGEFWAPVSVLFAAVTAEGAKDVIGRFGPALRRPAVAAACGLALAGVGLHQVGQARRLVGQDPGMIFAPCAEWIRDHVPSGAIVFTTDWDEFPDLFFTAPEQRYLVGLDPTFMYVTSPERWRSWRDIVDGRVAEVSRPILEKFHSRYLFVDAGYAAFIERADQDPALRVEKRDPECGVYSIRETPAGPPPGTLLWHADGAGGTQEAAAGSFVDVSRLHGTAGAGGTAGGCARLAAVLNQEAAATRRFGLSTDDRVTMIVNGRKVFDSAVAPAPSIDDVLAGGVRPQDHVFDVDLSAGRNDIILTTCPTGQAWGFFLSVREP